MTDSAPNKSLKISVRFVFDNDSVFFFSKSKISGSFLRLPSLSCKSVIDKPIARNAFSPSLEGADKPIIIVFKDVPAIEAFIPALPNNAVAAETCSIEIPADFATPPTYFRVSPISKTLIVEALADLANKSEILFKSSAANPNWLIVSAAMVAASANPIDPAFARFKTASVPTNTWLVVNPAFASSVIPCAA